MAFVATTTSTTAYYEITGKFWKVIQAGYVAQGWLNIGLTVMLMVCVVVIVGSAALRWILPLSHAEIAGAPTRSGRR